MKRDQSQLLLECARMLRRGQSACERQGWEEGESTEHWYFAAGQLATQIELYLRPQRPHISVTSAASGKKSNVYLQEQPIPEIDPEVLRQSIEYVAYVRQLSAGRKGFNILRSYESRLTIKPPTVHQF